MEPHKIAQKTYFLDCIIGGAITLVTNQSYLNFDYITGILNQGGQLKSGDRVLSECISSTRYNSSRTYLQISYYLKASLLEKFVCLVAKITGTKVP